jgi:probable FeS assembly SUF system protein SufT
MSSSKPIILKRECTAVLVPSGEKITLAAGSGVWLTQSLGGGYTVMTERGYMAHLDGQEGDALGMAAVSALRPEEVTTNASIEEIEKLVWGQLRSCFDPEIPVNIVDLGLIYHFGVTRLAQGGYRTEVHFTLTAQGCGMGEILKEDILKKLLAVPGIRDAEVALVWDPPWNQRMISDTAKLQLGIE